MVSMLADDVRMEKKLKEAHDYMRLAAVARAIDQRMSMLDFRIADVIANREITIPELMRKRFDSNGVGNTATLLLLLFMLCLQPCDLQLLLSILCLQPRNLQLLLTILCF